MYKLAISKGTYKVLHEVFVLPVKSSYTWPFKWQPNLSRSYSCEAVGLKLTISSLWSDLRVDISWPSLHSISYILESSILNLHKFRLHAVFPCINMYVHVHDNVASAIILELKSWVIAKKNKESKFRTPAYYS